jgi:hypothetical protein
MNIVRGPIEPTVPQLESWAVSDNGASEAFNVYEANDIWTQHGIDPRVNTCRRMIWLCRVGMFLDYKIAYSKHSECTESLNVFSLADTLHVKYPLSPITICNQAGGRTIQRPLGFYQDYRDWASTGNDGDG